MKTDIDLSRRPPGDSSRVRRAEGDRRAWVARNGQAVELPLIVDHVHIDPASGKCTSLIEAKIGLVAGKPELIDIYLRGKPLLDAVKLQRFFRWATPIDIVRRTVPSLLAKGIDPFEHEYPTNGYPDAARIDQKTTAALSDNFLEEVARQYVEIGHGYAQVISQQRGVSRRTVVSWVQKARKRGILSATTPGKRGGKLISVDQRRRKRPATNH